MGGNRTLNPRLTTEVPTLGPSDGFKILILIKRRFKNI